jgi:hypothetical protein
MHKIEKPKNQTEAVLWHLQNKESISSWEAIKEYGATRLSAIIFNLREDGYRIASIDKNTVNRFGRKVKYTEYKLLGDRLR